MRHWFGATLAGMVFAALSATAAEMPKRGGTLTYMIPADAPPSFDGHRENTFATIHAVAPFYSVLIRVNPENPASTTDFVCDVCTGIPEPGDDGRTYAFTIRNDVKFADGSTLTAADVAASWNKIVDPPEGVISVRRGYYSMIDKIEAPDPNTVVFRLKFATAAFLPALADPYAFIYKKEILDRDPHWYEKNIMGSGPFRFKEYQIGQSISGVRNPDYYHKGLPYLDGFIGIYADKQATRVSRDQRRPGGDRIPRLSAGDPRRTGRRARRPDHGAGKRLELRQPDHPEPRAQAVRRCPGAPRADPGDRPLEQRAGDVAKISVHADGRRRRVSRLAAGRDQGGIAAIGRLLARYREIAGRGAAAAQGSRRREPDLRIAQPQCRSALQIQCALGHRRMEQDRRQGDAARACRPARLPRRCAAAISTRRSTAIARTSSTRCSTGRNTCRARYRSSNFGRYEDPEAVDIYDRLLRETDFARQRDADAPVRKARARYRGARILPAVALPHRAISQLREGLEDQPEPLRQPGPRDDLAG